MGGWELTMWNKDIESSNLWNHKLFKLYLLTPKQTHQPEHRSLTSERETRGLDTMGSVCVWEEDRHYREVILEKKVQSLRFEMKDLFHWGMCSACVCIYSMCYYLLTEHAAVCASGWQITSLQSTACPQTTSSRQTLQKQTTAHLPVCKVVLVCYDSPGNMSPLLWKNAS